jgi:hypothetical protein
MMFQNIDLIKLCNFRLKSCSIFKLVTVGIRKPEDETEYPVPYNIKIMNAPYIYMAWHIVSIISFLCVTEEAVTQC